MVVHRGIGLPDKFRTRLIWNQAVVLTGFSSALTKVTQFVLTVHTLVALGGSQLSITCLLACIARTWYGCKDFLYI